MKKMSTYIYLENNKEYFCTATKKADHMVLDLDIKSDKKNSKKRYIHVKKVRKCLLEITDITGQYGVYKKDDHLEYDLIKERNGTFYQMKNGDQVNIRQCVSLDDFVEVQKELSLVGYVENESDLGDKDKVKNAIILGYNLAMFFILELVDCNTFKLATLKKSKIVPMNYNIPSFEQKCKEYYNCKTLEMVNFVLNKRDLVNEFVNQKKEQSKNITFQKEELFENRLKSTTGNANCKNLIMLLFAILLFSFVSFYLFFIVCNIETMMDVNSTFC